ncbi:MAG: type II toxin-antitoxin system RelE/ParE family toxin [Planctomycetota bacterium]
MKYPVLFVPRAEQNILAALTWYQQNAPDVSARWHKSLNSALRRLRENPDRFPLARETETFPYRLREVLFGAGRRKTHRVLFVVRPKAVVVYAIRHVAQNDFHPLDD